MITPWGNIEVSDAHAHLFSDSFFRALAAQKGAPHTVADLIATLEWDAPPSDNSELATRWVTELNHHGVSRSVLMSSVPQDEASIAEVVRAAPDRFYGYFMLNPRMPDALQRAADAFDTLGLRGLCLFPAMHCFSMQDDLLYTFLVFV